MAKKINVEKKARSDVYKGNDLFPSLAYKTSSFLSWMTCHASPVHCGILLFLCALNKNISCTGYTWMILLTILLVLYSNFGKQTYDTRQKRIDILRVTWQFCVVAKIASYLDIFECIAHGNFVLDRLSRRFHLICVCTNKCNNLFAKSLSSRRIHERQKRCVPFSYDLNRFQDIILT